MNTSKLRIGVEETKTARPCCHGLIIVYSERALDKQDGIFYHAKLSACKPFVRTLPFRYTNMFYNISCEFFCMVVRPLGLYLLLLLDNMFCHITFFVIFDELLLHVSYHVFIFKVNFTVLHFYKI